MRRRFAVVVLATLALMGCPGDRRAHTTIRAAAVELPTPMRRLAPLAEAIITGLRAPESVLYDAQQDVYFISNINGQMLSVDGNGFISRVDAKTLAVDLKWIATGLDGPKGMAILGDTLYVSDVTAVRKFDRRTGAHQGDVRLPGASFLNDLATDGKSVYVSDTGVLTGAGTAFLETGTDAIYRITGDTVEKIASGKKLNCPNGLEFIDGKLWVVTFGSNELYRLDGGTPNVAAELPWGQLDGVTRLADGSVVISSWHGNELFRGPVDGPFEPILAGLDSPADMGYDTKRHRLLVPHPPGNQVTIHRVR
jgi:sugar lactone lactonase YvrE